MKRYLDFKLVKIIALFYGIIAFASFCQKAYILVKSENFDSQSHNWFNTIFNYAILDWIIITPYMVIISIITKIMFDRKVKSNYIIFFHLALSLFIGWVILFTQGLLLYSIGGINSTTFYSYVAFDSAIQYLDITSLVYLVITAIIYIYFYIEKIKDVEYQKALLANQLTNVNIKILKAQLQPHFLFNTLNSISSLVESDTKQAQNTLADLSDLLREIINVKEDNLVTLEQELKLVNKYFDIVLIRFSDHLKIDMNVDIGLEKALIPSMLLQPLVENSIKHGYSYDKTELFIRFFVCKKYDRLIIKIHNNGKLLDDTSDTIYKKGVGLKNTCERLKAIYQNDQSLTISNTINEVIVEVDIPYREDSYKLI